MEDRVLAKPADLCCIRGAIHTGEAVGKMEQIGGIDTYVARPAPERSNGNVLLFFSDALGLHINSFLLMDAFAECGYLTLGVDYFLGVSWLSNLWPGQGWPAYPLAQEERQRGYFGKAHN